ncbi:MAG: folate-binding protein [Azoarcus sp.]|nr:folate-binding protein [Azoarcus sp.]
MNDSTNFLARTNAQFDSSSFTVKTDMPYADANALAHGAVAVPLLPLGHIRTTGLDAADFLHKLLSSDVAGLAHDAVQWSSFNTAQGRMLANFLLWRDGEELCFAPSADIAPALLKKLSMYVLRAKASLSLAGTEQVLMGLAGNDAGNVLSRAALPAPKEDMRQAVSENIRSLRINSHLFILDLPAASAPGVLDSLLQAGGTAGNTASWHLANIRAGLPLVTAATSEGFVAQMLNFELIGGVSFSKGCYPGQEIIARTQHLGKPKRRLFRIKLPASADGITVGTPLYTSEVEQPIGNIINVAPLPDGSEALAVLRVETAVTGNGINASSPGGGRVKVLDLPYGIPQ